MIKPLVLRGTVMTAMLTVCGCLFASELSLSELLPQINRAYGGQQALEQLQSLEFEFAGYRISRHQSRRTEPPYDRVPVRSFIAIDLQQPHVVRDAVGSYPGGLDFLSRSIIGPDGSFSVDTEQGTWSRGAMNDYAGMRQAADRLLPPLLVLKMNRMANSVAVQGRKLHRGTQYHHLQLGETGILVHPDSFLIYATISQGHDMATMGPLERWRIFPEYRSQQEIQWPAAMLGYLPKENTFTTDYRLVHLKINTDISPHLAIPDGFVEGASPHMGYANDGELKARPAGHGAWLAGDNNTNVLYVEFEDHFVAMETGGMAWYAERVYETMQPLMRGKPLRLVVPTHYHDDHAVGLRFYVRTGASVLTTPEKTGWLRQLLQPVDNGKWVSELKPQFVEGSQHIIKDSHNELRILRYANAPHSENMMVGYLPRQHSVFTADIFIGWGNTPEVRQGASYGLRHLNAWLESELGSEYARIETFLPVHGRPYSRSEIDTVLERERTFLKLPGNTRHKAENWFLDYGLLDETTSGRRDYYRP